MARHAISALSSTRFLLALTALLVAHPVDAILIRADREDAEYLELATRYPSAIEIAPGLEGVLIARRWVLTSAQCAMLLQGSKARPPVRLGGKLNAIQSTFIHPDWRQNADGDLALVLLRDPVEGIAPTPISRDRDEIEEVLFIVGHGETGKLGEGVRRADGRKRAAINTVDRVTPWTLRLRLKPAEEASDLQGAVAASERGAPAYHESMGLTHVAGIFSRNESDWQVFARVSSYAAWISDTMFRAAQEEAAKVK